MSRVEQWRQRRHTPTDSREETVLKTSLAKAFGAIVLIACLMISSCSTTVAGDKTQLTAEEVRKTFIDRSWRGPSGVFLFRSTGTYTYKDDGGMSGTWPYTQRPNGTLIGGRTNYTFYRTKAGGYVYYHSRSQRYYPAKPL